MAISLSASGSCKNAVRTKVKKTIPPMNVTMGTKRKANDYSS